MDTARPLRPPFLLTDAAALLGLVAVSLAVAQSALVRADPGLIGVAVTVDLTLTAALLHAWLGIRRGGLPGWTVVPVIGLGATASRLILPAEAALPDDVALLAMAAVELLVLGLVIFRITVLVRGFRAARRAGRSRLDAVEAAMRAVAPFAPGLARYVRIEAGLWTYALLGWWLPTDDKDAALVVTHHKKPQWMALVGVFVFLSLVEASLVHLWLHRAGHDVAGVVVGLLHLYGFAWLLGDAQALRRRPSRVLADAQGTRLQLRVGLRTEAWIEANNIAHVETGRFERPADDGARAALLGPANLRLRFVAPVSVTGLGGAREVNSLDLQVDDVEALTAALAAGGDRA